MKSERTPSTAVRGVRLSLLASVFAALTALALLLAAVFAAPVAHSGGTGQALALRAALRASQAVAAPGTAAASPTGTSHAPNGRTLIDRRLMRPGAILKPRITGGATSSVVPIPGAVQTFDVFNPPPAFRPLVGFGSAANAPMSVNNDPSNPPINPSALTMTNLTPVWSQDQTFIVFSSNRTLLGAVNTDGNGGGPRFHLWAISVNGGEAYQITTSAGPSGGGEFFPALTSNDGHIAFTSDAQSPGVQNLYDIPFSFSVLTASNNDPASVASISDTTAFSSLTMRGNDGSGAPSTGFDQVQRPTFSPSNDGLLVFSAHSVTGTNRGHNHIYFLFQNTGGFDPNNTSLPGKLTDGSAEDTDPTYSKDGQFIAFASTAGGFTNQPNGANAFSSDPNTSQVLSSNVSANGLRNLFLLSGGGGNAVAASGFGTLPASLQNVGGLITSKTAPDNSGNTLATDNFGPAWSSITFNPYTNAPPGFEYLAFGRAFVPAGYNLNTQPPLPHDIYYLQTVRNIDAGGESNRSDEAGTTPEPINAPVYQIDAGGLANLPGPTGPGTNGLGTGNYQTDAGYQLTNLNFQNLTLAFGGKAGPPVGSPFNQTNDPGTPSGIYNTSQTTGPFVYIIPNLTPGANYTVRFHLADPTNTAPGKAFRINVNGTDVLVNGPNGQPTNQIDIVQQAQQANGVLTGLVRDQTGAPVAGATISVTSSTGSVRTTPATITTTATTTTTPPPPSGDGLPSNYSATLPASAGNGGTYTVTITPPAGMGFLRQTQTVSVNSAGSTRANFTLNTGSTTLSGTVTDAMTTSGVGTAQITVTDPATNAVIAVTTTAVGSGAYTVASSRRDL